MFVYFMQGKQLGVLGWTVWTQERLEHVRVLGEQKNDKGPPKELRRHSKEVGTGVPQNTNWLPEV